MANHNDDNSVIYYSNRYEDNICEYRTVKLPDKLVDLWNLNRNMLLSEEEWRACGITQSFGWIHIYNLDKYTLLFRRDKNCSVFGIYSDEYFKKLQI